MLVLIAKLGTPEMLGQYALGLAVAGPVFILAQMQLRSVQVTDAHHLFKFGHYLALRILGGAVGIVVVLSIALRAGWKRDTALVVVAIGVAKAIESLSDILYGFWQKGERLDQVALAMGGRGIGSLLTFGMALYLTGRILPSVCALVVWWALWLLTYERSAAKEAFDTTAPREDFRPAWDGARLKELVYLSLPLGVAAAIISLNVNIPRYFILRSLGEAPLGYFAALSYVGVAGTGVVVAMGQAASPRLANYYAHDREAFQTLLLKLVGAAATLGALLLLVVLLSGSCILTALYRPDYAEHESTFVWVMTATAIGFIASILGYGLTAARRFQLQVPLFATVTAVNALCCWFLVPRSGLAGAAYASAVAALLSCAGAGAFTLWAGRQRTGAS
jgi:O-antigen/teichoic acid export membrane protein